MRNSTYLLSIASMNNVVYLINYAVTVWKAKTGLEDITAYVSLLTLYHQFDEKTSILWILTTSPSISMTILFHDPQVILSLHPNLRQLIFLCLYLPSKDLLIFFSSTKLLPQLMFIQSMSILIILLCFLILLPLLSETNSYPYSKDNCPFTNTNKIQ